MYALMKENESKIENICRMLQVQFHYTENVLFRIGRNASWQVCVNTKICLTFVFISGQCGDK